ncbi:hypothetical protein CR513_32237, partial [Mucuna pruriens]
LFDKRVKRLKNTHHHTCLDSLLLATNRYLDTGPALTRLTGHSLRHRGTKRKGLILGWERSPLDAQMDPVPDGSRLYFVVSHGVGPTELALFGLAWTISTHHWKPWLRRVVLARLTRPRIGRLYGLEAQVKDYKAEGYQRGPLGLPSHSGGRWIHRIHTLSSTEPLYDLDPEIEITLRRLRKTRNIVVSNSSNFVSSFDNSSPVTNISNSVEFCSTNSFAEQMENNERTLKELATPDVVYQPWCIQYPQLEPAQTYEVKSGLIHLLPKFHGLVREDPHKHLKEFHVGDMKRLFLEKIFPASKTTTIRKETCGIKQHFGETQHEYWERFNKLCATCPHHQISEQLLIQYFYEGLMMMDRSMIDVASGGALMDKTPTTTWNLISNMASNT